jgi:hypothetical protein
MRESHLNTLEEHERSSSGTVVAFSWEAVVQRILSMLVRMVLSCNVQSMSLETKTREQKHTLDKYPSSAERLVNYSCVDGYRSVDEGNASAQHVGCGSFILQQCLPRYPEINRLTISLRGISA